MKKKIIAALLLAAGLSVLLCGCKKGGDVKESTTGRKIESAAALLDAIWNCYGEDDKFPAVGGSFQSGSTVENAPGALETKDPAVLDSVLAIPEESADQIDDAASLTHMMNANTFTCGAVHLKDSSDVKKFAEALDKSIMSRQWICGFPERVVIYVIEDYVAVAFGQEDLINTFKENTVKAWSSAVPEYDAAIE